MGTLIRQKKLPRGAALALIISVLVLLIVLGIGLLAQSAVGAVEVGIDLNSAKAFWAAEAGLEKGVYILKNRPDLLGENLISETGQQLPDSMCTYDFEVTLNEGIYRVLSTGYTQGGQEKTVQCYLKGDLTGGDATVGHWMFDQEEGDRENVIDVSGNDNHGVLQNSDDNAWTLDPDRGEDNYVMNFDGNNDYVDTQVGGAPAEYDDIITVSLWTKLNEPEGSTYSEGPFIAEVDKTGKVIWDITYDLQWDTVSETGVITYQFAVRIKNDGQFLKDNETNNVAASVTINTSQNPGFDIFGWHHVSVIYDDSYILNTENRPMVMIVVDADLTKSSGDYLYKGIDYLEVGDSWLGHEPHQNKGQENSLMIGGREALKPEEPDNTTKDKAISVDGSLDDIRIYDKVLSTEHLGMLAKDEEPFPNAPGGSLERYSWSIVQN